MSFVMKETLSVSNYYPGLGLYEPVDPVEEEVTYNIESVDSITEQQAVANYSMTIRGKKAPQWWSFEFPVGGGTNLLLSAEDELKRLKGYSEK